MMQKIETTYNYQIGDCVFHYGDIAYVEKINKEGYPMTVADWNNGADTPVERENLEPIPLTLKTAMLFNVNGVKLGEQIISQGTCEGNIDNCEVMFNYRHNNDNDVWFSLLLPERQTRGWQLLIHHRDQKNEAEASVATLLVAEGFRYVHEVQHVVRAFEDAIKMEKDREEERKAGIQKLSDFILSVGEDSNEKDNEKKEEIPF